MFKKDEEALDEDGQPIKREIEEITDEAELMAKEKEVESNYHKSKECLINNGKTEGTPMTQGTPMPERYTREPSNQDPEKSHTKIVNVNTGVDDAYQERAKTGRKSAWKDESVTGLRNQYTYGDIYKSLEVQGFDKEARDNIIEHIYNAKSGKEVKEILNRMQIEDIL